MKNTGRSAGGRTSTESQPGEKRLGLGELGDAYWEIGLRFDLTQNRVNTLSEASVDAVRELGAEDYETRERALRRLVSLGEPARPAAAAMAVVLVPVVLGWLPIYLAAILGATLMILSRWVDTNYQFYGSYYGKKSGINIGIKF